MATIINFEILDKFWHAPFVQSLKDIEAAKAEVTSRTKNLLVEQDLPFILEERPDEPLKGGITIKVSYYGAAEDWQSPMIGFEIMEQGNPVASYHLASLQKLNDYWNSVTDENPVTEDDWDMSLSAPLSHKTINPMRKAPWNRMLYVLKPLLPNPRPH